MIRATSMTVEVRRERADPRRRPGTAPRRPAGCPCGPARRPACRPAARRGRRPGTAATLTTERLLRRAQVQVVLHVQQGAGDDAGVVAEQQAAQRGDHRQLDQEPVVGSRRARRAAPGGVAAMTWSHSPALCLFPGYSDRCEPGSLGGRDCKALQRNDSRVSGCVLRRLLAGRHRRQYDDVSPLRIRVWFRTSLPIGYQLRRSTWNPIDVQVTQEWFGAQQSDHGTAVSVHVCPLQHLDHLRRQARSATSRRQAIQRAHGQAPSA